jgi:predicted deacetylase
VIPQPAQYLLRFDDLCPTMAVAQWAPFEKLIRVCGIQPILAVIPENRDPELKIETPASDFWDRMRSLEDAGATIALHGYRHLCASNGRSMLPLHRLSEFAGVREETQRKWIRRGLEILRENGLHPRLWVAPRHGFDTETLRALQAEGIFYISDGFARVPFVRAGMTWIPQQLWTPTAQSSGVWTSCIHSNNAKDEDVKALREFLQGHAGQFTSFNRVTEEIQLGPLAMRERLFEMSALWRTILSNRIKVRLPRL